VKREVAKDRYLLWAPLGNVSEENKLLLKGKEEEKYFVVGREW